MIFSFFNNLGHFSFILGEIISNLITNKNNQVTALCWNTELGMLYWYARVLTHIFEMALCDESYNQLSD